MLPSGSRRAIRNVTLGSGPPQWSLALARVWQNAECAAAADAASASVEWSKVSQAVAMQITGHRTISVYHRYRMINEDDPRHALEIMQAAIKSRASGNNHPDWQERVRLRPHHSRTIMRWRSRAAPAST